MTKLVSKINHQYEFDIIRIIGAINIVLFHYTFRGTAAKHLSELHFQILGKIFKYGYLWIYLFFILSGYTIISSAYRKTFTSFIFARILRLYPSFWIAIFLTSITTFFLGGERFHIETKQVLLNLTMLNEYIGIESVDGAYWFMFVILKFYSIVSILLLFNIVKFHEYIAGIWLAFSMISTSYHLSVIDNFMIPNYAPFIISGMIFYSASNNGWTVYNYFIIIISSLCSLYLLQQEMQIFHSIYSTKLSITIVFLIMLSIYLFMYLVSIHKIKIILPKLFITLGSSTYPLYLIHQNIGYMLFNNFGYLTNIYITLILTLILMIAISLVITKYIDPYICKLMTNAFAHINLPIG